jgi:hypothetical protein
LATHAEKKTDVKVYNQVSSLETESRINQKKQIQK